MFKRRLGFLTLVSLIVSPAASAASWSWTLGLNAFGYGERASVEPGFGLADRAATLDLRPSWKFECADRFKFTIVPRLIAQTWESGGARDRRSEFFLNEMTASFDLSESISIHAGKESYQWGPAELFSPSNPIFHYTPESRSAVFLQEGKWLARVNLSAGKRLSAVALVEPIRKDDDLWALDRSASEKGLLKLEYAFDDGATYFGATGGRAEGERFFFGEYGNVVMSDAISAYFDARHTRGNDAYYPVRLSTGIVDLRIRSEPYARVESLVIMGVRFEGAADLRLEYVYNEAGYTRGEFLEALATPNRQRLLSPGLEVLGVNTLYASIRKSNLDAAGLYTGNIRYFHALSDHSGAVFGGLERLFGDRWVGFAEGTYVHGGAYSEAGFLIDYSVRMGAKLTL